MNKSNKVFFLFLCFITGLAFAAPEVESVAISGDKLIVTGHKFLDIDGLTLSDPQTGFKKPFKVESATESEIVGTAVDNQKITVASLMNLIIDTAKGETTYPVSFSLQKDAVTNPTIKNGAITPEKFVGVTTPNPPDQSVLTWDEPTQSFIFTSSSGGGGSSGVSDIVLGAGITGAPNTASGSVPISVDIGATGNTTKTKIPYFNSKNKIVLDSTTSPVGSLTGLSFKDGTQNFYMFNDNGLRVNSNAASDLLVMGVDGNLFLKGPVTVGGYDVCLSSGNCTSAPSGTSTVTATAPLIAATNSTGTTNISAGAVNTANNLVQLDAAGKFPATIPGVVRGPGTVTAGTLAVYSNTTGENLGNSGVGLQNLVTMPATPTTANKMVISTGTNRALGTTAYTIPNTSGVTGQVLALTATDTAGWIDSPASGVTSFKARTGAVVPVAGDYTATLVTSTATGSVAATSVQAAIAELDTEKLPKAGGTMTGTLTTSTQNALKIGPAGSLTGEIQLLETAANGTSYVGFKSPASIASNTVWTLPAADGTSGQVLSTNGSKVLSWTTAGAGGGIGDVVGPPTSSLNNLATYSDGTGKIIKDSGINSGNLPTMTTAATAANKIIISAGANKQLTTTLYPIPAAIGASGTVLKSDGTNVTWQSDNAGTGYVMGPATSGTDAISTFAGTDGKTLKNTTYSIIGNTLQGPTLSMSDNLAVDPTKPYGCIVQKNHQNDFNIAGLCQDANGGILIRSGGQPTAIRSNGLALDGWEEVQLRAMYSGQSKVTFWVGGASASTPTFTVGASALTNEGSFYNKGNFFIGKDSKVLSTVYWGGEGHVGIGTQSPQSVLDVQSTISGFLPPRMTTAQRDAIPPGQPGMVVFDYTRNTLDVRKSTGWISLGSGTGDVVGPAVPTVANRPALYANTTGKLLTEAPYTLPITAGTTGQVLGLTGAGIANWVNTGNVVGAATSATNNLAAYSDTTGKNLKDSGINSGNLPTMAVAATAANKIILSAGANKQLTTTVYPIPAAIGAVGTVLKSDGTNVTWQTDSVGTGDVVGPATSTNYAVSVFYGTTGKKLSSSGVGLNSNNDVYGIRNLTAMGDMLVGPLGSTYMFYVSTVNKKVGIGTGAFPSQILQVDSTDSGFLPPRMTTAQKEAIVSQPAGLMVFDSSLNSLSVRNSSGWISLKGDVAGPATSTSFAIAKYNDTTGKNLTNSAVLINATNDISGIAKLTSSGDMLVDTNTFKVDATNNRVGIGTTAPAQVFQIDSTTSGFLPPRMTTAQKDAIPTQTTGLVVFDTTLNSLSVRKSTGWAGTGDVVGPAVATVANRPALYADASGKLLKEAPYTLPLSAGTTGQVLGLTGAGIANWVNAGNVVGAATSTLDALTTFAGTDGKTLKNSAFKIVGNNIQGTNVSMGDNLNLDPTIPYGCFSHKNLQNSASSSGFCQNSSGEASIVGGRTKIYAAAGLEIYSQNYSPYMLAMSVLGDVANFHGSATVNRALVVRESSNPNPIFHASGYNMKIGIGTDSPQALLEMRSTTGGFLPPRMTTAQKEALSSQPGLVVFDTSLGALSVRNTYGWVHLNISGPATSTVNAIAKFRNTDAKELINSAVVINATNDISGIAKLTSTGDMLVDTNTFKVDATNNRVGIGTTSPSQVFQIDSTISGFLPPRMTTAQKDAIPTQTTGMVVFDTTLNSLNVRTSTGWVSLSGTALLSANKIDELMDAMKKQQNQITQLTKKIEELEKR